MPFELTLSKGGPLHFLPGLPPNYSGPRLGGARTYHAKTNIADLSVQELAYEDYSIHLWSGKFLERLTVSGKIRLEGLHTLFMMKGSMRKEIEGIGKIHLRQDQILSFYTEPVESKARLEKNKCFRSIAIFYSPKLLEELVPYFPELKNIAAKEKGMLLGGKVAWALPSMKDITNKLFDRDFDDGTLQFYFDLKVRELLYEILEKTYKRKRNDLFFTPFETARIHQAKDILLKDYLAKKPPTLRYLSHLVKLNSFKLKHGFAQNYDMEIFDWLIDQKMQYAKNLLLNTNELVKEICKKVGYPRSTNFITAFKRHVGMTPGSLRRK